MWSTLLDELKIERAVIGGASMGGYAALAFLQLAGDRVDGLVLANTRAGADSPEARANRRNMLALLDREGPSGVAREMMPKLLGKTTRETNPEIEANVRRLIKQQSPIGIRTRDPTHDASPGFDAAAQQDQAADAGDHRR